MDVLLSRDMEFPPANEQLPTIHKTLNFLIASVWIGNGLFCKLMNLVPRHQLIVSRITTDEYALLLTRLIGISEIAMAVWILSAVKARSSVITQITLVATMNVIEYFVVPDLLLFGR